MGTGSRQSEQLSSRTEENDVLGTAVTQLLDFFEVDRGIAALVAQRVSKRGDDTIVVTVATGAVAGSSQRNVPQFQRATSSATMSG